MKYTAQLIVYRFILTCFLSFLSWNGNAAAPKLPMKPIQAGDYYVGSVHGKHAYREHTNVNIDAFNMMAFEMDYQTYETIRLWSTRHGYSKNITDFSTRNKTLSVSGADWWDAILLANALSEWHKLPPYYVDEYGKPLRKRSTKHIKVRRAKKTRGYRLPSYEQWQVAARGGQQGITEDSYGQVFAGSNAFKQVAWFPNNAAGQLHKSGLKKSNELGIYDLNGNVSEWLDTPMGGYLSTMMYYCGGSYRLAVSALSQCDTHSRGFREDGLGFRLIR